MAWALGVVRTSRHHGAHDQACRYRTVVTVSFIFMFYRRSFFTFNDGSDNQGPGNNELLVTMNHMEEKSGRSPVFFSQ